MNTLADVLDRSPNAGAVGFLLVLAWIASSDGNVAPEEMEGLRSIAASAGVEPDFANILGLANTAHVDDLQLALELLAEVDASKRTPLLQVIIGMALSDGYLRAPESHIIRLIADLWHVPREQLDTVFREMTGHPFPEIADVSAIAWWKQRASRPHTTDSQSPPNSHHRSPGSADTSRLRDLGILGLDESAGVDDVRAAYRRMAQIHHPDRYASLGAEAVKAAEVSFCRIRAAYERLTHP